MYMYTTVCISMLATFAKIKDWQCREHNSWTFNKSIDNTLIEYDVHVREIRLTSQFIVTFEYVDCSSQLVESYIQCS